MDERTRRALADLDRLNLSAHTELALIKKVSTFSDLDKLSSRGQLLTAKKDALESRLIEAARGLNLPADAHDVVERLSKYSSAEELLRHQEAAEQLRLALPRSLVEQAREFADRAQSVHLQHALDRYRLATEPLADKLLQFRSLDAFAQPGNLAAFVEASAVAEAFRESSRVDRALVEVAKQFSLSRLPTLHGRSAYGRFLDASGLLLPKWPNARLLTVAQKRHRLNLRLKNNVESSHERKGKAMVKTYELTPRDVLDEAMSVEYGPDWAETRLLLCGCKDLHGKWKKRGGEPLDHADYAHYVRIMVDPDHFNAVFSAGFYDPSELRKLLERAGELRNALAHHHPFSPSDLRDLRTTWALIDTGLVALIADYDVGSEL